MHDDGGHDVQAAGHLEDLFEAVVVGPDDEGARTSLLRLAGHHSVAVGRNQASIRHGTSHLSPMAKGSVCVKYEGDRGAHRSFKTYHRQRHDDQGRSRSASAVSSCDVFVSCPHD